MRTLISTVIAIGFLTTTWGCAPHLASYTVELTKVDFVQNTTTETFSDVTIGDTKMECENELFSTSWDLDWHGASLVLENKTLNSFSIIWDQSVFIDPEGFCYGVVPSGIKYTDKAKFTKPTKVVGEKSVSKKIIPGDFVTFDPQFGWVVNPYLPKYSSGDLSRFSKIVSSYKGKEIIVLLAIEFENQITEYSFVFEITKARVIKGNEGKVDSEVR